MLFAGDPAKLFTMFGGLEPKGTLFAHEFVSNPASSKVSASNAESAGEVMPRTGFATGGLRGEDAAVKRVKLDLSPVSKSGTFYNR